MGMKMIVKRRRHLNPVLLQYTACIAVSALIACLFLYGMFTCKPTAYPELW